jgi:hypothetical protein
MNQLPNMQKKSFEDFWTRLTRKGDPIRRPNLTEESFNAGWYRHELVIREACRMLEALQEIWEEADNRADIDDEGRPNFAMQIKSIAGPVIERATGESL